MKSLPVALALVVTSPAIARAQEAAMEDGAIVRGVEAGSVSTSAPAEPPRPVNNTLAYLLGGVGLASIAVGTTTGLFALEEKGYAEDHCSVTQRLCDADGVHANDMGRTLTIISAATLALGSTALLGGFWLYDSGQSKAQVGASVSPHSAQLTLHAIW